MTRLAKAVLQRTTTAQQLADLLSDRILAGAFAAGDRLRESALAGELGVARNTVREAVRILELSGLVRYEVNRGAVVISPTVDSVDALYTARERLESAAVAQAVSAEQLERIELAYTELVAATRTGDARRIVEVDLAFHAAIVSLLDSSRLSKFYDELTTELQFYLMVLSTADREFEKPRALLAEHKKILDAVRSGDTARSVEAVRAHVSVNAQRLREILTRRALERTARLP